MTNGQRATRGRHLETAIIGTKIYVLQEIRDLALGVAEDLPVDFVGATASLGGASGLVPKPNAGDNEKFLRGDGTWATVSGGSGGSGGSSGQIALGNNKSTVNGGLWFKISSGAPVIKMRYGNSIYSFTSSQSTAAGVVSAEESFSIYDSNNRVIARVPILDCTAFPANNNFGILDDTDNDLLDNWVAEYEGLAAEKAAEQYYVFWFDIPPQYKTSNFSCLQAPLEQLIGGYADNGLPSIYVNGNPMELNPIDGYDDYYVKITEFGAFAVMFGAQEA